MKKIIIPIYFLFLISISLFSYLFIDPNLIYLKKIYSGFAFYNRTIVSTLYVFFLLGFFGFYIYFLRLFSGKIFNLKHLKIILLGTAIILFFSYPGALSYDIFNYTTTSKVLFGYLENPYVVMPIEFPGETFLSYTHAANKISLYAPFWLILTGIPYFVGSLNFILMMFSFKAVAAGFYFLTAFLILKMTKETFYTAFFALNPLVLFETIVSGHNDIVMMFLALASIYLLTKNKIILSIIFIMLSILIKYATIFLLPVFVYYFFLKLKNRKINPERIFNFCAILMFVIFLLSPLRVEIYPWYFIWVLSFIVLTKNVKFYILSLVFSFFLMLRYVPFMLLGTHFGITPLIKTGLTFVPLIFLTIVFVYSRLFNAFRIKVIDLLSKK